MTKPFFDDPSFRCNRPKMFPAKYVAIWVLAARGHYHEYISRRLNISGAQVSFLLNGKTKYSRALIHLVHPRIRVQAIDLLDHNRSRAGEHRRKLPVPDLKYCVTEDWFDLMNQLTDHEPVQYRGYTLSFDDMLLNGKTLTGLTAPTDSPVVIDEPEQPTLENLEIPPIKEPLTLSELPSRETGLVNGQVEAMVNFWTASLKFYEVSMHYQQARAVLFRHNFSEDMADEIFSQAAAWADRHGQIECK